VGPSRSTTAIVIRLRSAGGHATQLRSKVPVHGVGALAHPEGGSAAVFEREGYTFDVARR